MSRTIDSRPVERTTRRTVAVLLTFISLGVLSGPLASTSGAASTSGSLTFAGFLSGTVNLKSSELNCSFPPTNITITVPLQGKSYTVWIDYSVAKRGKTTNLKTGGRKHLGGRGVDQSTDGCIRVGEHQRLERDHHRGQVEEWIDQRDHRCC